MVHLHKLAPRRITHLPSYRINEIMLLSLKNVLGVLQQNRSEYCYLSSRLSLAKVFLITIALSKYIDTNVE